MKLLLLTTLLLISTTTINAQSAAKTDPPVKPEVKSTIDPAAQLNFRTLQLEHVKRMARMLELKTEFDKLQAEQAPLVQQMNDWIQVQAVRNKIDLKTHDFNVDTLQFIEKSKEKPEKP